MKKTALYIILSILLLSCTDNFNVRVTGTVEGGIDNGDSIFLMSLDGQNRATVISKSIVHDSSFTLSGNMELPAVCNVVTFTPQGRLARKMDFIAEGGDVQLKVLPDYYRIGGTALNDAMQMVRDSLEIATRIYKRYRHKIAVSPNLSPMGRKEADDAMAIASYQYRKALYNAIEKNIGNILAPYFIKNNIDVIEPSKGLQFIKQLPSDCKDNVISYINKLYTAQQLCAVGNPFVDFKMRDAAGTVHTLSAYAGKGVPVLIYLWTAGNATSLDEARAVCTLQQECGSQAQFIGISIDRSHKMWRSAIEKEGLCGIQLTDLKGWDNQFMQLYGIDKIPYFVLIAGDGIIHYRGISFADASSQLKERLQR